MAGPKRVGRAGGTMHSQIMMNSVEELRQAGLAKVRAEEFEAGLELYDAALAIAEDEDTRELITLNKADAMIACNISGPEVQQLPTILMRRRNLHHAFLAAYALMFKHRMRSETPRGIFYGQVALEIAKEAGQPLWQLGALNELGVNYEMNSQFEQAIESFEAALELMDSVDGSDFGRIAVIGNLGYNKILTGKVQEGLFLIHSVLDRIDGPATQAEAYIDLCFGYLDLNDLEHALQYGRMGLELASDSRQIRNAHYLLGEVAYKMGDIEQAEEHFEQLARFYPQFRNLKSLLFAIDLRGMVNLKL
jgi:tetratricopeptide (TPR) repeat protein